MGGEEDRDTVVTDIPDHIPDGQAGLRIEAGGELVKEDDVGVADERKGRAERDPVSSPPRNKILGGLLSEYEPAA